MPVYEYQCKACRQEFEYQQRMSDPDMTTCEACGGSLERLISRTAFQLKGSGWYKDLYSSQKPAAAADKAESKGESSGAGDASAGKGGEAAASSGTPSSGTPSSSGGSASSSAAASRAP